MGSQVDLDDVVEKVGWKKSSTWNVSDFSILQTVQGYQNNTHSSSFGENWKVLNEVG